MSLQGRALVESDVDLIVTSGLVCWNGRFVAEDRDTFNRYWPKLHHKYGRWFCWHAFCVGAECILMGAYDEKGLGRAPFGGDHNWNVLGLTSQARLIVEPAIKQLAKRRNEGAHKYVKDVRDAYFLEVENEYAPALNLILEITRYPTS